MSRSDPQMVVRVPPDIKDRLRSSADRNRRSMNAELVYHLDRALMTEEAKGPAATAIAPSQEHDQPR